MRRLGRVLIGILVLVTLIHIFGFESSLHAIKHLDTSKFLSQSDFTLKAYHEDKDTKLVVMEKSRDNIKVDNSLNALYKLSKKMNDHSVQLIEGYDYVKLNELELAKANLIKNTDPTEILQAQNLFFSEMKKFFDNIYNLLKEHKPSIEGIDKDHYNKDNSYPNSDGKFVLYDGHLRENYKQEPVRTKSMLLEYLKLSDFEVESLRGSHDKYLQAIPDFFPEALLESSKYNDFMKGDGIMYLAGEKYNQLALLSIKLLRSSGSKLPVEVIIPKKGDYDITFCNSLLPLLNAKCLILSDYLPGSFLDNVKGFQLKNVALLLSSFQRVLYLDADALPISNPDVYFANDPFSSKSMVIWPDLWRRSVSPYYYDIANIKVNENKRVRNSYFKGDERGTKSLISYHDCEGALPEASSETGQMLIDKKVHFKTLLLSLYYNWYGPNYYYTLFSQGAAGEGDKETFIAAAHKLNIPYYQVQEFNREFGPLNSQTKKYEFFAMGQYDPILDYFQSEYDSNKVGGSIDYHNTEIPKQPKNKNDGDVFNYDYHLFRASKMSFLHAN